MAEIAPIDGDEDPDKYLEQAKKRLPRTLRVMDRALAANKLNVAVAAWQEINKILGYSKLTVDHTGSIEHNVKYVPGPLALEESNQRRAAQVVTVTPALPAASNVSPS